MMYGKDTSMAAQRRQESQGWLKRQGPSLCEERRHELETASTRGRLKARLFLRPHGGDEKEIDIRKNSERPEL
jgi:hypothetical protein